MVTPVRARALPFAQLGSLPGEPGAWAAGGSIGLRNAIVAGAWWMAREVELSATRACLVELTRGDRPTITWHLPASKTDAAALGVARTHGCICGTGWPRPLCPTRAVWDQLLLLQKRFPERWHDGVPGDDLPLFPSEGGGTVSKAAMTATILRAAAFLGVPPVAPDGSERVGGHSLRPTGAQGLARLGVDLWSIQLLGRWGSTAVQGYVREASLDAAARWAARAGSDLDLESVLAQVAELRGDVGALRRGEGGLEGLVDCVLGRLRSEVSRASLRRELLDAAARHSAAVQQPAATAAPEGQAHVLNRESGVLHAVLIGPPVLPAAAWATRCGWKFGLAPHAIAPAAHRATCQKCFRGVAGVPDSGGEHG